MNTRQRRRIGLASIASIAMLSAVPCLIGSAVLAADKAEKIAKPDRAPPLVVAVDPRVELVSVLFRLAGNPEYSRGQVGSYARDVEKQFSPFRKHAAVELAKRLRETRGVSFDACMDMAVHLADPLGPEDKTPLEPWPEGMDNRWPIEQGREFARLSRQFAREAGFGDFWKRHRPLYETAESRMRALLNEHAHLDWFPEFFGPRPDVRFTVALGMLNGPSNYGVRCRRDGAEHFYCVLGVWQTDFWGQPKFTRDVLPTLIHEFCHSYTNPIVQRHEKELRPAGEKIYPHVARALQRQAYGSWTTMMYESLVRASVIRYVERYDGPDAARRELADEKKRQFLWVEGLSERLAEYEADRKKYPTLEVFFPRIVQFFNDYAERFEKDQKALMASRPKVVSVSPADGAKDVDPETAAIRVVFDRPMRDGCWSLVGGGPHFPETTAPPSYDGKRTTWTVAVRLKSEWDYQFMLNSDRYQAFQSEEGVPLEPVRVSFKTGKRREGK